MNVPKSTRNLYDAVHLVHTFYEVGVQKKIKGYDERKNKNEEWKQGRNAKKEKMETSLILFHGIIKISKYFKE